MIDNTKIVSYHCQFCLVVKICVYDCRLLVDLHRLVHVALGILHCCKFSVYASDVILNCRKYGGKFLLGEEIQGFGIIIQCRVIISAILFFHSIVKQHLGICDGIKIFFDYLFFYPWETWQGYFVVGYDIHSFFLTIFFLRFFPHIFSSFGDNDKFHYGKRDGEKYKQCKFRYHV